MEIYVGCFEVTTSASGKVFGIRRGCSSSGSGKNGRPFWGGFAWFLGTSTSTRIVACSVGPCSQAWQICGAALRPTRRSMFHGPLQSGMVDKICCVFTLQIWRLCKFPPRSQCLLCGKGSRNLRSGCILFGSLLLAWGTSGGYLPNPQPFGFFFGLRAFHYLSDQFFV